MSAATMASETITDIVADLREWADNHAAIGPSALRDIADRIEEAARRDAAIHAMTCEANERLREHLEIALEDNKRTVGNSAVLREALLAIKEDIFKRRSEYQWYISDSEALKKIDAALAKPPRNCDRFGGNPKMLRTAWWDWTGSPSGHNPDGTAKLSYPDWLLAMTAKNGGEK